jgi:hypothetical protein
MQRNEVEGLAPDAFISIFCPGCGSVRDGIGLCDRCEVDALLNLVMWEEGLEHIQLAIFCGRI